MTEPESYVIESLCLTARVISTPSCDRLADT